MNIKDLPDIDFVDIDKDAIVSKLTTVYTQITKRKLSRADPVRLFILVMASTIVLLLNRFNKVGKQNMLAYATGDNLDHIGVLVGVSRLPAQKATSTVRLTLSTGDGNRSIPKGTRFSTKENIIFQTVEDALVLDGYSTIDLSVECTESGVIGNGFTPGMIDTIIDRLPYVSSVTNLTESDGGSDIETDDHLRQRINDAPESFSCAGPSGSYEYFAKKVSTNIENVLVVAPKAGEVVVYPVMKNGVMPTDEILTQINVALSDKKVRPLTDKVSVKAPNEANYTIDMTYYINTADRDRAVIIQQAVELAVQDYVIWQRSVVGRDINPYELISRVMQAGVKRVVVNSPVFTHVKSGAENDNYVVELAVNTSKTVTYGGYEDE